MLRVLKNLGRSTEPRAGHVDEEALTGENQSTKTFFKNIFKALNLWFSFY